MSVDSRPGPVRSFVRPGPTSVCPACHFPHLSFPQSARLVCRLVQIRNLSLVSLSAFPSTLIKYASNEDRDHGRCAAFRTPQLPCYNGGEDGIFIVVRPSPKLRPYANAATHSSNLTRSSWAPRRRMMLTSYDCVEWSTASSVMHPLPAAHSSIILPSSITLSRSVIEAYPVLHPASRTSNDRGVAVGSGVTVDSV